MAKPQQEHDKATARAWQKHGKSMAGSEEKDKGKEQSPPDHQQERPLIPCVYWARRHKCSAGDYCRHVHYREGEHTPTKRFPIDADLSKMIPLKDVPCKFYNTSVCYDGDQCPMKHDPLCASLPEHPVHSDEKEQTYTEEEWKEWAEEKMIENLDSGYSLEQWIYYLKEQEEPEQEEDNAADEAEEAEHFQ